MHAQKCGNGNARAGRVWKSDHVPDARAGLSSGNIYWARPQLKPGEDHLCAAASIQRRRLNVFGNQALADRHSLHELGLRTSVVGQTRPSDHDGARCVRPLMADVPRRHRHDRFVPFATHCGPPKLPPARSQSDLIGPVSIVGGSPSCGVPIKPGAAYGITARDGEASTSRGSSVAELP